MNANELAATNLLKRLLQAFKEGRTYFVFNEYDENVAGPIGKDGAHVRTFHDRKLYHVNAKNMEGMVQLMSGEIPEGSHKNYCIPL